MKKLLNNALKSLEDEEVRVGIEDILNTPCPVYHSYRMKKTATRAPVSLPKLLRKKIGLEYNKKLREYLGGVWGPDFIPQDSPLRISQAVSCEVLGTYKQQSYVFSWYVVGNPSSLPGGAKVAGAYLASLLEQNTAYCIVLEREAAEWSVWKISGSSEMQEAVSQDAKYVEGVFLGKAPLEGVKEDCIVCEYGEICEATEKYTAQPYPMGGVTCARSTDVEEDLRTYLWGLNQIDDGRNTGFLSPSEMSISKCDRRMVYKLLKTPRSPLIPVSLRKIFDMGHAVHDVIQRLMHEQDKDFKSEETAALEGTKISGSCDGRLGRKGLEIKSISHSGFVKIRSPKKEHKKQASTYAASLDLNQVLFVYYDKRTGDVAPMLNVPCSSDIKETKERAKRVEALAESGVLPDRVSGWGCQTCAYDYTCNPPGET